jgi:hypothetical protein
MTATANTPVDIDVMIVIDTGAVVAANPSPSTDPNNPTGIAHGTQYMICSDPRGIVSGQGTGDLNFNASPGDFVSFAAQSVTANAEDAVIIYNIVPFSGTNVLDSLSVDTVSITGAVFPNSTVSAPNVGIPPVQQPASFNTVDARVKQAGTEGYKVSFGLYQLDPNSNNENQILLGYYSWDPTITVS